MAFLAAVPAAIGTLLTASTATTAAVAGASTTLAEAGAAVAAVGTGVSAYSSYKQSQYQAQVAQQNAQIAANNRLATINQGNVEESEQKTTTAKQVGAEVAAQGANNVDVGFGSPAAVTTATQNIGDLDAATIRYNASRTALGYAVTRSSDIAEASGDQAAGANILASAPLQLGGSFLSSASSIAGKSAAFKTSGAANDPMAGLF